MEPEFFKGMTPIKATDIAEIINISYRALKKIANPKNKTEVYSFMNIAQEALDIIDEIAKKYGI